MILEHTLHTEADTAQLANFLAQRVLPPALLGLSGDLGSGKTTFVRHLVSGCGSEDKVTSPTYVLQQEYLAGLLVIEHWDLFRVKKIPDELTDPPASQVLRVVEWIEKFPELTEQADLRLSFSIVNTNSRLVKIEATSDWAIEVMTQFVGGR